jgi:hypothetical protein
MKKIQRIFEDIVNKVENNPTPFVRYLFLFAALLSLRLALEFFSSNRLFTLDDILHIGLWFIFIVMAFLIQLQLFSGEKIMRVAKLVIVFFSIALTAPIIDLVLSGGRGAKMNYLALNSWKDVLWSYVTIGGSSFSRGATPGIRIEIVLLVIASFNYVRTKKDSIVKGVIAAICIYSVLFLSGAIPLILGYIVNTLKLQYQHDDQSTLLLLLTLDLFLLFIALFRNSPRRMYEIFKAAPWGGVLLALLHAGIGITLSLKNYPGNWILTPTTLFWFPLLAALATCFVGYAGILRMQNGKYEHIKNGLVLIVLLVSCMISAKTFFTSALLWGLLFILNEQPLELKNVPVLRNILGGMIMLAVALMGFSTFNAPMVGFPTSWILVLLPCAIVGGVFTEMDKKESVSDTPISPAPFIKAIYSVLLICSFVFAYIILLNDNLLRWFFLMAAIPPILFLWVKSTQPQYILGSLAPAYMILLFAAMQ